jgi:hypothetical protein
MSEKNKRAHALFAIRTTLGLSTSAVAAKVAVTPRTVGLWETRAQPIPDGPWRLFMHEVQADLSNEPSIAVVFADDGVTPVDAISDRNFFSIKLHPDGTGVVASYAIDRYTQRTYLHLQRFRQRGNEHVIRAAEAWEAGLRIGASTGEKSMLAAHRWLTRRVLEAEQRNPKIRELKNSIATANDAVDFAPDEASKNQRLQELDTAVFALIQEVENAKKNHAV